MASNPLRVDILNITKVPNHEDILEIMKDNTILRGIYLGQVAAKESLNVGVIGVTNSSLIAILATLNKVLNSQLLKTYNLGIVLNVQLI